MSDVRISRDGHVAVVEICRAPNNFFDEALIRELATVFEESDADPDIRSIVLCSEGKNFCAGANFNDPGGEPIDNVAGRLRGEHLYRQAVRLFRCRTPVVAVV